MINQKAFGIIWIIFIITGTIVFGLLAGFGVHYYFDSKNVSENSDKIITPNELGECSTIQVESDKDYCYKSAAISKKDLTICDNITSNARLGCYVQVQTDIRHSKSVK